MKIKPITLILTLLFCLSGNVFAEFAPKKVFEIDLNNHTNLDVVKIVSSKTSGKASTCSIVFESNFTMVFWFTGKQYYLLPSITYNDYVVSLSEENAFAPPECIINRPGKKILFKFRINNGLQIYKFDYSHLDVFGHNFNLDAIPLVSGLKPR